MIRWLVLVAGIVGAAGVGLGAYGAHGLAHALEAQGFAADVVARKLNTCDIAVRYHLVHAVALLALAAAPASWAPKRRNLAGLLWIIGLALFCGCLYAAALANVTNLNAIVPLGGVSFILGWLVVASTAWTKVPSVHADQRTN